MIKTNIENYKLIEKTYLEDQQADALVFEHIKTKAKIFVLANNDNNKVFSIGFRTPPKDSTGVCHILEHSVLNGSKKYRTKEPFMDLLRGSLQTFLNAMTYPDKTIYPIASRNTKDFENLMDVYLDAVFNPIVKTKKEVFMQEGWRYHLLDKKDEITYKGVVYNEMKGAMSSAKDQVAEQINQHLLPDTIYALNSGGDPYSIPDLSYEAFKEYHDDYYHPSNSYIFLYGNLDYSKYLTYIDEEYLSNYQYNFVNSSIVEQETFDSPRKQTVFYNVVEEKEKSNYISYSCLMGKTKNTFDRIMSILVCDILINSESSPLKDALINEGLAEDIVDMSSNNLDTSFSLLGKNIDDQDIDAFIRAVDESLEKMVDEGIEEDLIMSNLNKIEFDMREKGGFATKGIIYLIKSFDSWLYDESPIQAHLYEEEMSYIKENISQGLIEKYIEEKIINNPHKSILVHKPKLNLNKDKDLEVKKSLQVYKDSLSEEEIDNLIKETKAMADFQNREDSLEDKKTIPSLDLEDVTKKFKEIPRKEIEKDGYSYLIHDLATSGIDYIDLSFDISHIESDEIAYMAFICQVLGMVDTENYSYKELNNKVYMETGAITINPILYSINSSEDFLPTIKVSTKVFSEKSNKAIDLIEEIILKSKFDDKKRIKELLNMINSRLEMALFDNAHALMINRALSHHRKFYKYNELTNGIDYLLFIRNLIDKPEEFDYDKLASVYEKLFNKNELIINISSDFTQEDILFTSLDKLASKLIDEKPTKAELDFDIRALNEGFSTASDVQYVSMANDLNKYDYRFTGKISLLSSIISKNYLYNEIRAKGGAYGAGLVMNNTNTMATYSYRDPNLKDTLKVYKNVYQYVEKLDLSDDDLKTYIIGTVGNFDPPLTERAKGSLDLTMYLSKRCYKDIERNIEETLASKQEDLVAQADLLKKAIEESSLAVLGNSHVIEENKDIFDRIIKL